MLQMLKRGASLPPHPLHLERGLGPSLHPLQLVDADNIHGEAEIDHDAAFTSASTFVGKGSAAEKKPRKNFTLPSDDEDAVFEWLEENELLRRRGHKSFKDTNKKRAMWQAKGSEFCKVDKLDLGQC